MRFWDVQKGRVRLSGTDVSSINTGNLREMESLVTQETHLFHDSIKITSVSQSSTRRTTRSSRPAKRLPCTNSS